MFAKWLSVRRDNLGRPERRHRATSKRKPALQLEALETRDMLAVAVVNAGQAIRPVDNHVLGVNVAWWDSNLNTAQTQQMVQAAGLTMFRFPGGSTSDTWHFDAPPTYNGEGTSPSMARFIASTGGTGMVTLDYGSGSPQEAAAFLAYLNGSTGNTTVIGSGAQWDTGTNTWVQKDWKTAGYWAGLRATAPLAQDDGLNFLRIGRAAPFSFHYYEVGNEIYGSWETDNHGLGGDTGKAHDPATYVTFAKQFGVYSVQIDPSISIGEVTGSVSYDNNWTASVLQEDAAQGFTPGFLSDHVYVQAPGSESDSTLLLGTVSSPTAGGSGSPDNWPLRAAGYRSLLNQKLGASASKVELLATEFNSVYSNPGKQSTSLVNGLYVADSLGIILQTEYNAADVWDLRNGWDTGNNNAAGLYGWRKGGDYGLLGGGGSAPSTGTYVPYPTYFAEQLVSKMDHTGDTVVKASSNDANLTVYAVKEANGHLDLLVINKSATADLTGQFQVAGFSPSAQAQLWQYGKTQDTAQSQTSDGHSGLASFTANLSLTGSNFSYTFPSYSMTVMDLSPPTTIPTTTTVAASAATATYGQPITFSATVTASGAAPTGSVEFFDVTTGADLGPGSLQSSGAGTATWAYTTTPTQLKVTGATADVIKAVYTPSGSFVGSSGTLPGGEKVTPLSLTVVGVTANNKMYDQKTAATLNTGSAALVGVLSGDAVTLNTSGASAAFASKDVGNGIPVTVSGLTLGGTQASNYLLIQPMATANITPAPLTATGIAAYSKVYDGTTTATLDMTNAALVGVISGDAVTVTNTPGATLTGLHGPEALAFDTSGNLYVTNDRMDYNTVSRFVPGSTTPSATLTGLNAPFALAFDAGGNLYVANYDGNSVSKFAPGSTSPSATLIGLNGPTALAIDAGGNVYVTNPGNNTVSKFAPGSTSPTATLSGLDSPSALAFDASGNLFVASRLSVSKYAPGSTTPSATLTGLNYPVALAFDSNGNLYVANSRGNTVSVFAPGSTTPTATLRGGLNRPTALAIDTSDNLYVANQFGTTVSKFTPGSTTPSAILAGLNEPGALAFDSSGNLFVVNSEGGTDTVSQFTKSALSTAVVAAATFASKDVGNGIPVTVSVLTLRGAQAGDYTLLMPTTTGNITPATLTVTGLTAQDKVYDGTITATVNTVAAGLAGVANGDVVTLSTTPSTFLTGLNGANALAFDAGGNLYVANLGNNTVSKFTPGSTTPSATLTGLSAPYAVAVDAADNVYIANYGSGTVSKFTPGSVTPNATLTGLDTPNALAFDSSGNLYVTNLFGHTVSEFAPGSTMPTATLTGLDCPTAIAFDASGNLYIADDAGNTVKKFTPGSTTPRATLIASPPRGAFSNPNALAFDRNGNLYVANDAGVSKFAPGSTTPSATLTGLYGLGALAFDTSGNLYVAYNDTVSKFAPGTTTPSAIITGGPGFLGNPNGLAFDTNGNLFVVSSGGSVSKFAVNAIGGAMPAVMAGAFESKDVGNHSVAVPGLTISGVNLGDYQLAPPRGSSTYGPRGASPTANITPALLTVTGITANNKVYDGTSAATLNTTSAALVGILSGDQVAFGASPSATLTGVNAPAVTLMLAVDATGNVYVANADAYDDDTVSKFAPGSTTPTATLTGVHRPLYGMATDAKGNLFVSSGGSVSMFPPGSTTPSATLTGLTGPNALVFDASGSLFVANSNGTVSKFAPGSTTPSATLVGTRADRLAVDANGNIYAAYSGGTTVIKFAPGSTTPSATLTGVNQPTALAVDSGGNLYVGNADTVSIFSPGSTTPSAALPALEGPTALAVDAGGNLYVATYDRDAPYYDVPSGAVSRFAPGSITPSAFLSGVNNPSALAFDAAGNLYVANQTNLLADMNFGTVSKYSSSALGGAGTFVSKRAGNNIPVTTSGLTLGGAQALDYTLIQPATTANITPAPLTITAATNTKPYDGTASAQATPTATGLQESDTVTGLSEAYTDPNPGVGKTLIVTGYTVGDGNAGKNYTVTTVPNTTGVITSLLAATHFQVTAAALAIPGAPVSVTVTAIDLNNNPTSAYTGTVHFSSTDSSASLPANMTLINGTRIFSATLNTIGVQTISASDTISLGTSGTSNLISVSTAATQFAVSAPSTATAGNPFLVTVTAQDGAGRMATGYSGTVQLISTDGQAVLPSSAALTNGIGSFLVTLKTAAAGPWTIGAKDRSNPAITGTSASISVSPGAASYFTVAAPGGTVTTGTPLSVTVTAYDAFGNIATGYKGHVHFTSSDAGATLPADATLTGGVGAFSITLGSAGNQTITVTDTLAANPTITGTSSPITTRGLTVTSFTPTATGFTASFSKPFLPADLTLYGPGLHTVQDVTLVGAHVGAINGSLLIDPSSASITFNATANSLSLLNNFGSVVLPDDTYTATLLSGSASNGFLDALGSGLDGMNNAGHADYTTTFTTHYQANATPVLAIPDFARGPDGTHAVKMPNDTGHGIPITLYNAAKVTDVTFTLIYNPMLLALAGAFGGPQSDATDPAGSFKQLLTPNAYGQATFQFHDATAQSGTVVFGDINATVPDSAAGTYKAKELLHVYSIGINEGAITGAVSAAGVHVNAYLGDVTGNGTIDGLDVATAANVAQGKDTGFAAYALLDPAVVGDVALDYSVDAGVVSDLAAFTVHLATPVIPAIPTGLTITPIGADPTLSLGQPSDVGRIGNPTYNSGIVSVPVLLDQPHPEGSTGMTEAVLALTYDPALLSVSASDITLGSIPALGAGWQLHSVVDQATGQIGIVLFSTTPITANQAGSLVNIAFHVKPDGRQGSSLPWPPATAVQLVSSVLLDGQQLTTQVDDAQGQLVLRLRHAKVAK